MELARLLVLAAICAVAYLAGEGLARVHVPRLPVYLAVGTLASVVITSAVQTADLVFPVINSVALCVIGFIAGSHLIWRVVQPRLRPIVAQVIGMSVAVFAIVAVLVFILLSSQVPSEARLAAAILAGTVMLALSPPEAIAVISESRAVGPFTRLVLGATVVMDVVVVSAFSVSLTAAKALLGEGVSVPELAATVGVGIGLALLAGVLVSLLLGWVIKRVGSNAMVGLLILVLAGLAAWLAEASIGWAHVRLGLEVEIEPLLPAMIAGLLVVNRAAKPERLAEVLERLAPWVYAVFFTLTGLGLHIDALVAAAAPAALLWLLRLSGLWAGSTAAMTVAKEPAVVRRVAWRAFVPQAGIALALASTIAAEFPQGGPALGSLIIATIVLNEATGPFFLRSALRAVGETVPEGEMLD